MAMIPTERDFLALRDCWQQVAADLAEIVAEPGMIVYEAGRTGGALDWTVVAFAYNPDNYLLTLKELAYSLTAENHRIGWLALVTTAYMANGVKPKDIERYERGDLEQMYRDGDTDILDVLIVTVMDRVTGTSSQCFVQPLLEPVDEPARGLHGGQALAGLTALLEFNANTTEVTG